MTTTISARPAPGEPAAEPAAREPEHWMIGGAAAEVATRLRCSSGFLRLLIFLASFLQGHAVLGLYVATTLLLPHDGRRLPGWSNLVGLARVGLVFGVLALMPQIALGAGMGGLLQQGPEVWVPVAGAALIALAAVLVSQRPVPGRGAAEDRRLVLSALIVLVPVAGVALTLLLAPGVRADRLLALCLPAVGAVVLLLGRRLDPTGVAVPAALLTSVVILFAVSGAPFQGGIGDTYSAPRTVSALRPVYRRAIGDVTLDLSGLHASRPAIARITLSAGIGDVRVALPYDARATVQVHVGDGGLDPPSPRTDQGFALRQTIRVSPQRDYQAARHPGAPLTLQITARVGKGCVVIGTPGDDVDGDSC